MSETAKDPVCGMAVDIARAKKLTHNGRDYYFCSDSCQKKFQSQPLTYAGRDP